MNDFVTLRSMALINMTLFIHSLTKLILHVLRYIILSSEYSEMEDRAKLIKFVGFSLHFRRLVFPV